MSGEPDPERQKIAEPYQKDIDFAFFAVNFGYSKKDYEALTPREVSFIYKAWEDRIVVDKANMYDAVLKATYNVNRPKKKKPLKLFEKHNKKVNKNAVERNKGIILENAQKEGRGWIDQIYRAIGRKPPNSPKGGK